MSGEGVGKEDARFILAVADEYAKIIDILGPERVCELLAKPIPEPDGYRQSEAGIVLPTSR